MIYSKAMYKRNVVLLIILSALIRSFIAVAVELGNDEVYYRLYALYPDWSHFDHPPMVGLVMQLFSLNMLLQSEFFLRLGSIIFGSVNIWLVFQIGSRIRNERTGWVAALLYVSSIYATVITGIFILPDTPQSLFWLLALYLIVTIFSKPTSDPGTGRRLILMGLILGLGILSKYTTVFLWLGIGLYILLFSRKWLKVTGIYYALLISLLCILPVIIWNFQNNFISFTFHSSRVDVKGYGLNLDYFLRELLGEFFYNNPVNYVLIIITLVAVVNNKLGVDRLYQKLIVLTSLPLIFTFLVFSLFRETLPHWSAPAYTSLLILAAAWLDQRQNNKIRRSVLISAVSLIFLVLLLGYLQINQGITAPKQPEAYHRLGKNDPSLDMFGYGQAGEAFATIVKNDVEKGHMPKGSVLVGDNWFPLANYDYYAARPLGMKVFGLSDLDHLHKYAWINRKLGGFQKGMFGYYITDSKYYRKPNPLFYECFEDVIAGDTIPVYRNNKIVKRVFIWRLKNLVQLPPDPLDELE